MTPRRAHSPSERLAGRDAMPERTSDGAAASPDDPSAMEALLLLAARTGAQ